MNKLEILFANGNQRLYNGVGVNQTEKKIIINLHKRWPECDDLYFDDKSKMFRLKLKYEDGDYIGFFIYGIDHLEINHIEKDQVILNYN